MNNHEILKRYENNPILVPNKNNWWESEAVFNCAIHHDKKEIHMLYRAIGEYEQYISRIGIASSENGYLFKRREKIALEPILEYERHGIEDPRISEIDHRSYITYVVLDRRANAGPIVSTALAVTTDYLEFQRLGLITGLAPHNKDVVIFPTKFHSKNTINKDGETYFCLNSPSYTIRGTYGVIKPSIWLGEGQNVTKFDKHTLLMEPTQKWEEFKIGAGPPPIKTKYGWLVIYHGVSIDKTYSAGAALLDLEDPRKVVYRSKLPILVPTKEYEKYGDVKNVVFPTGACNIEGELFVYYGGADKRCCVATVELNDLLEFIMRNS